MFGFNLGISNKLGGFLGSVANWMSDFLLSTSFTKVDVGTAPTTGVEFCKVPQTYPLIEGTHVTDNLDGTYTFLSTSKYELSTIKFWTDGILQTAINNTGTRYRLKIGIEFVQGELRALQVSGSKFKEQMIYDTVGTYEYDEIIDVTGVNPQLQMINYATTGLTTEFTVTYISVQELNPQETAYLDTTWIPAEDTDWSISTVVNTIQKPNDVIVSGLKDETTAKYIRIGQKTNVDEYNIQASVCGSLAYEYIDSGVLGEGRQHCVLTYNATTKAVSFYIGGKLIGTQTSAYTTQSARSFWLGHYNTSDNSKEGRLESPMEDFIVYEEELTQAKANELLSNLPYIRVSMAGDSTFTGILGWYRRLQPHMPNNTNLIIPDTAKGGATALSFYTDGSWEAVKATTPKYIFLGFGQNDWTSGVDIDLEFKPNINLMLDEAIAQGITPYLFTPCLSTVSGADGTIQTPNNDLYGQAIEEIGASRSIPVIDLTEKTRTYFTAIGTVATAALHIDSVHFNADGAEAISILIREELDRLGIGLT